MKTINDKGLKEIALFLAKNHRLVVLRSDKDITKKIVHAWADDAESQLSQGNPPTIEIKSFDSIIGKTVEYTVSNEGVSE